MSLQEIKRASVFKELKVTSNVLIIFSKSSLRSSD